jgi:NTE family protein
MKENVLKTDIYIKPNIKDFGVISFDKGKEIILKGEEATFAVYEKIKELVDESNINRKPKLVLPTDSLQIVNINSSELDNYTKEYVIGKLRFKSGAKISYKQLEAGMNNINATGNFRTINYTFDPNNGGDDLNLILKENKTKSYLKFGLHYDGLFKSAVLVNLTRKKTLFKNDVASLDIALGDNFRYNFGYYIENGYNLSFGFKSIFNQFNKNITGAISNANLENLGINAINVDFSDMTNQVYFQSLFVQKFLIGGGLEYKLLKIKSETLANSNPIIDKSDYLSVFGYLNYDSFDNKSFPRKGWYFSGDIQSFLLSSDYTNTFNPYSIAKTDFGFAATILKNTTIKIQTEAGFAFGDDSVNFFNFVLGGYGYNQINNFRHFYGYDFLSLGSSSYIKSTATIDYEFVRKNHLNISANFANLGERMFENISWVALPKYTGYAVGYGLETIIGPIEVKHTWSPETKKGYTWFSVGFSF